MRASTAVTVPSSAPTIASPSDHQHAGVADVGQGHGPQAALRRRVDRDEGGGRGGSPTVTRVAGTGLCSRVMPPRRCGEAESTASAEGVGELDADADSSPPPSTNSTTPSATAAGEDGPRDRGALHAGSSRSVRSTASTSSRPTTIASVVGDDGRRDAARRGPRHRCRPRRTTRRGTGVPGPPPRPRCAPPTPDTAATVRRQATRMRATGVVNAAEQERRAARGGERVRKARHPTHRRQRGRSVTARRAGPDRIRSTTDGDTR